MWCARLRRGGNLFRCGEVTKRSGWENILGRGLKLKLYLHSLKLPVDAEHQMGLFCRFTEGQFS